MARGNEFDIVVDTSDLYLGLYKVQEALDRPGPMLKLIAERHLLNIDQNFKNQSGVDGDWKPLSKKYREWKQRQPRAIQKTLQFSGLMRAGINYELTGDGRGVSIGSDKVYGPRHEEERSFLRPTEQQIEGFGDVASDYIDGLYGGY